MENTATTRTDPTTITKTLREYSIRYSVPAFAFVASWKPINEKTGRGWNSSHDFIAGANVAFGPDPRPRYYSTLQIATAAILAESK